MSAREFNQDVSAAKRAARAEPLVITDRGAPSHVLLTIEDYRRLTGDQRTIVDWLRRDDGVELVIEPSPLSLQVPDL